MGWAYKMNMTLIKYRTSDTPHNQHVVVPTVWLSDLLDWLTLSESAEIVETTHDVDHEAILPIDWPSYEPCMNGMIISALIALGR